MLLLIQIPDDYTPPDGNAFDAVRDALEHFEIPSGMLAIKPETSPTPSTSTPSTP